jgi:hypothetical protein
MPLVKFACYFPNTAIADLEGNSLLLHSHLKLCGPYTGSHNSVMTNSDETTYLPTYLGR